MTKPSRPFFEIAFAVTTVVITMMFTYAQFFQLPYLGFNGGSSGRVTNVFTTGDLQVDDRLERIGSVSATDFFRDWRIYPLDKLRAGDTLHLVIRRGDRLVNVDWTVSGFNDLEFLDRLSNQWWLASIFCFIGTITLISLRPRDNRWRLLIAFNFLTAIWLVAGGVTRWHLWYSPYFVCGAMWLSAPVYLHLHWSFPKPLWHSPRFVFPTLYAACVLLAIANFLQFIPTNTYSLVLGLSAGVSLLIVIVRFFIRPEQRAETGLLVLAAAIACIPIAVLGLLFALFNFASTSLNFLLLAIPLFPLTYFYAAYRKLLGKHELRANQFFASYIFFIVLASLFSFLIPLAQSSLRFTGAEFVIPLVAVLFAGVLTALLLRPFQALVERHLFNIKLPSDHAIAAYVARLTTDLTGPHISHVLLDEILHALFIKQSTLIRFENGTLHPHYLQGVADGALPRVDDLPALIAEANRYRPDLDGGSRLDWIRVVLPLTVEDETTGVWLLGSRAPDDFYSQREINLLKTIADQTALALTNIAQSERLKAMYRANTARYERERLDLAHELHDTVLNDVALVFLTPAPNASPEELSASLDQIAQRIRRVISGLRPPILDQGLYFALDALPTNMEERYPNCPQIVAEISTDGASYDPAMELDFYRIAQQACENAIRHAKPNLIRINGKLTHDKIFVTVEDNGGGFPAGKSLDLNGLLMKAHYGLAGMIERAESHNGTLKIDSTMGRGTTITLTWVRDN